MSESDPRILYQQRLDAWRSELESWSTGELVVSWSRLAAVLLAFVLGWLAIQNRLFSVLWATLPLLAFFALVVVHERVLRRKGRCQRLVDFYRHGIERLDHQWMGKGDDGERFRDPEHMYAEDLDLFGSGSLFELLSVARTRGGCETLARWLKEPAEVGEIRSRQEAVADLAGRLDLREDLWSIGLDLRSELDPQQLIGWAGSPSTLTRFGLVRWLLPLLALGNVVTILGWWLWGWGPSPFLALILLQTILHLVLRKPVQETISGVDRASRDLKLLAELFARIDEEAFESQRLKDLVDALGSKGSSAGAPRSGASDRIHRLQRLVDLLESRRNAFFAPIAALLQWTGQLAFRVDDWRQENGASIDDWLAAIGDLEALSSLATFSFERPDAPFPQILEAAEDLVSGPAVAVASPLPSEPSAHDPQPHRPPTFEGEGLGHPLLAPESCVRNDIALGPERQALIVSGSNMSGKSTYLRTCGVNAILALAGAPVVARSLRLSPLAIGSTIRIQDSLQGGASRFYTEIVRLRGLLELARGPLPAFFLLDEILHGTNSHDRRIGAEGVLRAFLDRGAIGLVTTHDLALSEMAKDPESNLVNVHFEDTIEEGKVHFDYRLRSGVVERSNALALMREVGLDV